MKNNKAKIIKVQRHDSKVAFFCKKYCDTIIQMTKIEVLFPWRVILKTYLQFLLDGECFIFTHSTAFLHADILIDL